MLQDDKKTQLSESIDEMVSMTSELKHLEADNRINLMVLGIDLMLQMIKQDEING